MSVNRDQLTTPITTDAEMLQRIVQKYLEPFDPRANEEKTLGKWRSELRGVLNDAVVHVRRSAR